jgi:hypothetical protein
MRQQSDRTSDKGDPFVDRPLANALRSNPQSFIQGPTSLY